MFQSRSYPVRVRGLKSVHVGYFVSSGVVPRAGTWIEIDRWFDKPFANEVVPRAGTWIEIVRTRNSFSELYVVPRAGTWIEIQRPVPRPQQSRVVPRAGTWIEIPIRHPDRSTMSSYPVRVRGLKSSGRPRTRRERSGRTPCGYVD